nr:hypothetical protein [Thermoleptolyngbya sichuanensis]
MKRISLCPGAIFSPIFSPIFPNGSKTCPRSSPRHIKPEPTFSKFRSKKPGGDCQFRASLLSSESTLEAVGGLIRESVDFDSDHLDLFSFKDAMGRTVAIHHPYNDWRDSKASNEVLIGDLPLQPGMSMTYLFDFGDCWEFNVQLEEIQPGKPKRGSNKILERHGKAPEQSPNWENE